MGLRNIFTSSSNPTYTQNIELMEEYDLLNTFGSPNRLFLKFLKKRKIDIEKDEITEELIEEFVASYDSIELELSRIQKQKDLIFKQRRVWVSICRGDEWIGSDLILDHEGITIDLTGNKILYSEIEDIEICDGGWSKKKFQITTSNKELVFTINEDSAVPLIEILQDIIENEWHDDLDELMELYDLLADGKISEEEFEIRKAAIYNDTVFCTNCGFKLEKGSSFCSNCGHKIN